MLMLIQDDPISQLYLEGISYGMVKSMGLGVGGRGGKRGRVVKGQPCTPTPLSTSV